jgi:IclR family transcriptional regulator, acetate operon repressor
MSDDMSGEGPGGAPTPPRYRIDAVDRAIAILEALGQHAPVSQAQLARATNLSEATTFRYLNALGRHDLVERDADSGRYRPGIRLFQLGQRALANRDPRLIALPTMRQLLEQYGETVNLAMRWGNVLVLIDGLESERSLKRGATVGERDTWHASAVGKAILAHLPELEVRTIVSQFGLAAHTPKTVTGIEALLEECARIRELGYAIDDEEGEHGLRCVGAPIFDRTGEPAYAFSLSGPSARLSLDALTPMGEELAAAAALVSERLGYAETAPAA